MQCASVTEDPQRNTNIGLGEWCANCSHNSTIVVMRGKRMPETWEELRYHDCFLPWHVETCLMHR
jgi:hypothetical protein